MNRTFIVLFIVLCLTISAFGWGNEGHMAINKVAAQALPSEVPAFLKNSANRLAYLGPEPDRWREKMEWALKASQEPDHFIDLEPIEWLKPLPQDRYRFYQALYERRAADPTNPASLLPEKVGLQPYIAAELYGRLKVAFREYRHAIRDHKPTYNAEQNVIFYAGWLGHYVGDGANPLHTTVNYNGWTTTPNPHSYTTAKDIHWKMEGVFVGANISRLPFANFVGPVQKLQDSWADYVAYLYDSNKYVERVYQLEQQKGFDETGTPESRDFLEKRLAAGARMLARMWYTAWLDSAVDPPPYVPPQPTASAPTAKTR
jgi:hypothetical protein